MQERKSTSGGGEPRREVVDFGTGDKRFPGDGGKRESFIIFGEASGGSFSST